MELKKFTKKKEKPEEKIEVLRHLKREVGHEKSEDVRLMTVQEFYKPLYDEKSKILKLIKGELKK